MDSSNHGKKAPPKESSSDQSSSHNDSSPPPPPVAAPPHMMYYQPGTGYPGHGPPPYHPYPPPPAGYAPYPQGYNNYPGTAPYYNVPQNYHHHANDGGRSFVRGFIMCSCLLFTGFFISTLIMALMLHPQLPVYKVTSLTVENFNTTSVLTGDWNISITVENPNDRLRGYFSDFKVDVVHDNDEMAVSYVPDFELEKHEQKQMDVKTSSHNGANGVSFQKWDLDKMSNERQTGSVLFGVRVSSMTAFKSSSLSTRNAMMLAICEGLKVVFQNNTGTGTLDNGGNPVNCQLYM